MHVQFNVTIIPLFTFINKYLIDGTHIYQMHKYVFI